MINLVNFLINEAVSYIMIRNNWELRKRVV